MASSAALHVLADYVKMLVTLQFPCETNHVEAEPPRVAVEVGQLEITAMFLLLYAAFLKPPWGSMTNFLAAPLSKSL